jgi:hypothetical protein
VDHEFAVSGAGDEPPGILRHAISCSGRWLRRPAKASLASAASRNFGRWAGVERAAGFPMVRSAPRAGLASCALSLRAVQPDLRRLPGEPQPNLSLNAEPPTLSPGG